MNNKFRHYLSMPGLLNQVKDYFLKIPIAQTKQPGGILLADCLMSGLAIFSLKYSSLLQFDERNSCVEQNLKSLYGIGRVPGDT